MKKYTVSSTIFEFPFTFYQEDSLSCAVSYLSGNRTGGTTWKSDVKWRSEQCI